jgi:dTMP kinase
MKGIFITFEGTEGSGKSTQIAMLAERLHGLGRVVRTLREPGGTPIGEEIRHTLKHSEANEAMTAEAELLLMNASRAQLVRQIIRPALAAGQVVLCDRFFDSTVAYQGYGRGLDLQMVRNIIEVAVGTTRPDLTLLLEVPLAVSEERRLSRQALLLELPETKQRDPRTVPLAFEGLKRDRMEEADRSFFERVERGYAEIARSEPGRIRLIDATLRVGEVQQLVWKEVEAAL